MIWINSCPRWAVVVVLAIGLLNAILAIAEAFSGSVWVAGFNILAAVFCTYLVIIPWRKQ